MNAISRVAVPRPAPQIITTREAGSIGALRSDGWSIVARKVRSPSAVYEWWWNGLLTQAAERTAFDRALEAGAVLTVQDGEGRLYAKLARRDARRGKAG